MAIEKQKEKVEAPNGTWSKIALNLLALSARVTQTTKANSEEKSKVAKASGSSSR